MALLSRRFVALGVLIGVLASPQARAGESLEDAVKATYLYKFAPFVSWPASARVGDTFNLCVSGEDAVTALLPEAVAGQKVDGRAIALRHLAGGDSESNCHILYVANSVAATPALDAAQGKPILTVTQDGTAGHGIIRLTVIAHHVRFDIDAKLAADNGLAISSKLLSLAHDVTPAPPGPQ